MKEAGQELDQPELVTKCNSALTAGFPIQCDKSRRYRETKGFVVAALGFFVPQEELIGRISRNQEALST